MRWFDGSNWGPYAPEPQTPYGAPASDRRFTIHYGFALLAIFSLLGTVIPGLAMVSTASDPETEGIGAAFGVLWFIWGGMWTLVWVAFAIQHTLRSRR